MGLRYRKRVRVSQNTHLNVGTRKASVSVGKPGLTVNLSRRGARATIGIPGTGLSYVTKQVGGSRKKGSLLEELIFVVVIVIVIGTIKLLFRGLFAVIGAIAGRSDRALDAPQQSIQGEIPVPEAQPAAQPATNQAASALVSREVEVNAETFQLPAPPVVHVSTSTGLPDAYNRPSPSASPELPEHWLRPDRRPLLLFVGLGVAFVAAVIIVTQVGSGETNRSANVATPALHSDAQVGTEAAPDALVSSPPLPDVPPLIAGEVPPTDLPNYFDAKELGAASYGAVLSCRDVVKKRDGITAAMQPAYCLCFADAARLNVRRGKSATVTKAQHAECIKYSRNSSSTTSPFGGALPGSTAGIVAALDQCMGDIPSDTSPAYGARVCSCTIDATIKHKQASESDIAKCAVAARYFQATGSNLTIRQFNGLK